MSSSFDGVDVFGSGPHRFVGGRRGSQVLALGVLTGDPAETGVVALGARPVAVVVEGWLVGVDASALGVVRDAVLGLLTTPPRTGTLVDHDGRSWAGLSFTEYEETGPVSRGRVSAVPYLATFRELVS